VPVWLARSIDIRRGEGRALARASASLFLILSGYTVLETARDALLLTRLPLRAIGIAYVVAAVCVLPASGWVAQSSQRFGMRLALVGGLIVEAVLLCLLFAVPTNGVSTVAIYAVCSLVGAVLVPLFWGLLGASLTVVQARRLLGPVGAAGALGAAVGSGAAAGILSVAHTKALLLVAACLFLGTSTLVALGPVSEARKGPLAPGVPAPTLLQVGREEPFVWRIAALAVASTAAVVALDFFFKWSVARSISHQQIARFIAIFYAVLNAVALVGQLVGSASLVRRAGVAAALVVTPGLLFCAATGTLAVGGALAFVLLLKTIDGVLRNPVNRIATELIYLPVRPKLRAAAKPFVDGALTRAAQATVGAALLGLGAAHYASPRGLATGVLLLVGLWLVLAITTRRPYLALLARAIKSDSLSSHAEAEPVDLETAEELVQHLADEDPLIVIGAMNALARRGRERLIPALVLLHPDEAILLHALAIFAGSKRQDWVTQARRLLRDPRELLRIAAVRALAAHGQLQTIDLDADSSPRLQGYAALQFASEYQTAAVLRDSRVDEIVSRSGQAGEEARIGLLLAIADAEQNKGLLPLLRVLETAAGQTREWTEGLARAVRAQRAADMIPALISRITERGGREAVRSSLVSFGRPALDEIWKTLLDSTRERALRIQLPASIARFGSKRAAELLLESIETENDGRIRYRAIRGLGQVVAEHGLTLDRARLERLSYANLLEYFRLLGLRAPLSHSAVPAPSAQASRSTIERLLAGLLEDKLRQSLERTFRLLKIAHPSQDIHRVNVALTSKDLRARANAAEFLDTLLGRPDQSSFRRLFQVLEDDLSYEERVARAAPLLHAVPPQTRGEALERLERDRDATVAALAAGALAELLGQPMSVKIGGQSVGRVDTNSQSSQAEGNPDV
jgi:AAA family ATP:ADP antiporter